MSLSRSKPKKRRRRSDIGELAREAAKEAAYTLLLNIPRSFGNVGPGAVPPAERAYTLLRLVLDQEAQGPASLDAQGLQQIAHLLSLTSEVCHEAAKIHDTPLAVRS